MMFIWIAENFYITTVANYLDKVGKYYSQNMVIKSPTQWINIFKDEQSNILQVHNMIEIQIGSDKLY